MERITKEHPLSQSADIIKQNLDTLKTLFPTIVKEGKIDLEELRVLLGEELETSEEYYRFTWAGKSSARLEANKPSIGTLRPVKSESKFWDTTKNIFVEGDNLEVLKLLQKSYANKIKMIYIDPPYNTGNDFVYKDNYADNLGNYFSVTGQTDEDGKKISTNTESDGRYHSNWLNMMYPRLKLARNLLNEEGVIFISIDDNEVASLRIICNEIFGEENFIGQIIWKSRQIVDSRAQNGLSNDHEYIISYSKMITRLKGRSIDKNKYSNPDNDERGPWMSNSILGLATKSQRPNLHYDLIDPETGIAYPCPESTGWRYSKETIKEKLREKRIVFPKKVDGRPREKKFLSELNNEFTNFSSILDESVVGFTLNGTRELREILSENIFPFPKPISLIKNILTQGSDSESIILDFYAGSGTTAHAIMQLNAEDGGERKFICVQLPEPLQLENESNNAGYKTIADITKERIRRAGEKIKSEFKKELFNQNDKILDIGFRVFKLDSSNINAWDGNVQNFESNLLAAAENIKEDRTEEDVLYEILIKAGLDLAQPVEEKTIDNKKVFNVGLGALFICLSNDLTTAVAEGIGKWKEELNPTTCKVIFKDTGFNDVEKTNSMQILKRYGITEVNTI